MVELVIARIGKAQGLRGEVSLVLRTDDPAGRLEVGAMMQTRPADRGPLKITRVRHQGERWFVTFYGIDDRTGAEELNGIEIVTEAQNSSEPNAWYAHELSGLSAVLNDGTVLGEIVGLDHMPAQDLLVVRTESGERVLVPFVQQIVPTVDVPGGRVVLNPPGGLFPGHGEAVLDHPEGGKDTRDSDAH